MKKDFRYFAGLMTGTSVDAVDAVLIRVYADNRIQIEASHSHPIPNDIRQRILSLFTPGDGEIDKLGDLDIALAQLYAASISQLLSTLQLKPQDIAAIGSHGQTIRHRPNGDKDNRPFTLQIGDPNTIAALTGIITVADFRRKDIALGGQGAPLTPIFHAQLAKKHSGPCAFLNVGGIANLSIIDQEIVGFDTGPGNCLMDAWINKHQGKAFDQFGEWAASGKKNDALIKALTRHPYFVKAYPKSTGREEFTLAWLEQVIEEQHCQDLPPEDIQACLLELSARTMAVSIRKFTQLKDVFVCGGGIYNDQLMQTLQNYLPKHELSSTDEFDISPDLVEATAFAWLAKQSFDALPGNCPSVTGAVRAAILGGVYLP